MRVPDVYIVGAQKSGTTTLFEWISQHPDVYSHPHAKDFPFFSSDQAYTEGSRQFEKLVESADVGQLALGADVNSMYTAKGPERMRNCLPNAKLIVVLRDPVQRAYSSYCFAHQRSLDTRTFEEAIGEETNGIRYEHDYALQTDYLKHGHYHAQLTRLLRYFPNEKVKVVVFENLRDHPALVLTDIFRFLNVDDFEPDYRLKNETKGGSRSKMLAKLAHQTPRSSALSGIVRTLVPFSVRTSIRLKIGEFNKIASEKPIFPSNLRRQMEEYYVSELLGVEALLGRTLTEWRENWSIELVKQ